MFNVFREGCPVSKWAKLLCVSQFLLVLQVITLEGWVDIMYYLMDAHSFYNFIYFILLIIVSVLYS